MIYRSGSVIADVIQIKEIHFFDEYLERIAKGLASLLDAFPVQPAWHIAPNPIALHAYGCPVLYQGSRSWDNDLLFAASNAEGLCCDDYMIEDAGISKRRRAWVLYKHDSLCDFAGASTYTTFFWLSTAGRKYFLQNAGGLFMKRISSSGELAKTPASNARLR